ncbi:hypothetical protein BN1708_017732, partial [Verticillium longisporum]
AFHLPLPPLLPVPEEVHDASRGVPCPDGGFQGRGRGVVQAPYGRRL